mmetsp:Transcript_112796/g.329582  ORF Transcript_112796/g.329582 Transcript_112796/m.329582 type:complete len:236 (+) Transcript_112796:207-914(+)
MARASARVTFGSRRPGVFGPASSASSHRSPVSRSWTKQSWKPRAAAMTRPAGTSRRRVLLDAPPIHFFTAGRLFIMMASHIGVTAGSSFSSTSFSRGPSCQCLISIQPACQESLQRRHSFELSHSYSSTNSPPFLMFSMWALTEGLLRMTARSATTSYHALAAALAGGLGFRWSSTTSTALGTLTGAGFASAPELSSQEGRRLCCSWSSASSRSTQDSPSLSSARTECPSTVIGR